MARNPRGAKRKRNAAGKIRDPREGASKPGDSFSGGASAGSTPTGEVTPGIYTSISTWADVAQALMAFSESCDWCRSAEPAGFATIEREKDGTWSCGLELRFVPPSR